MNPYRFWNRMAGGLGALLWGTLCVQAQLQEQIDAAANGATLIVPAGVYSGSVVIRRPLTLVGQGRPTLQGHGRGKVVHIASEGVTLRGFRITGSGLSLYDDDAAVFVTADHATVEDNWIEDSLHGVYLKKASDCRIVENRIRGKTTIPPETTPVDTGLGTSPENCDLVANRRGNGIHLWNCERNEILGNEISEARDGIYFSFANHTRCVGNRVRQSRYGLHYMYSDDNAFVGNVFSENAAGAALMFSERLEIRENRFASNRGSRAYGIILQSVDDARLERNWIDQNAVGVSFNQCNRNRMVANELTQNYIGLRFGSNSDENGFSLNLFARNLHAVEITGENGTNTWALSGVGNAWNEGRSFDLDQDGIEDLPHRELDLFGVVRRDFPLIALLSESPALKLLRFAHQRAALPGLTSLEDRAPLNAWFFKRHPIARPRS